MDRIAIFGSTCSGKSTFAINLSELLDIPVYHLDDLFWEAEWKIAPTEIFQNQVKDIITKEKWVIDGNYSKVRERILNRVTHAIILNPPLLLILWRLLVRTLGRSTKIRLGKISRLPSRIEENEDKEFFFKSFAELAKYAFRFKKRGYKKLLEEISQILNKESVVILRRKKNIRKFLSELRF
ncbi:hypothetical protein ES705_07919 [subsurface metagenome]